jgi:hypothetical protein
LNLPIRARWGARSRAAGWEEKPLQVAGAINTYTARLAEATVFRSPYLSGGGVAGKFAMRAGPGHQDHGRCAGLMCGGLSRPCEPRRACIAAQIHTYARVRNYRRGGGTVVAQAIPHSTAHGNIAASFQRLSFRSLRIFSMIARFATLRTGTNRMLHRLTEPYRAVQ